MHVVHAYTTYTDLYLCIFEEDEDLRLNIVPLVVASQGLPGDLHPGTSGSFLVLLSSFCLRTCTCSHEHLDVLCWVSRSLGFCTMYTIASVFCFMATSSPVRCISCMTEQLRCMYILFSTEFCFYKIRLGSAPCLPRTSMATVKKKK